VGFAVSFALQSKLVEFEWRDSPPIRAPPQTCGRSSWTKMRSTNAGSRALLHLNYITTRVVAFIDIGSKNIRCVCRVYKCKIVIRSRQACRCTGICEAIPRDSPQFVSQNGQDSTSFAQAPWKVHHAKQGQAAIHALEEPECFLENSSSYLQSTP
jgi:hypothetical protein